MITVYTDGSCKVNPGPGGCSAVFVESGKTYSTGYQHTTNSRMEMMGVLLALESEPDKSEPIVIWSDSGFVVNSIKEGWVFNWKRNAWKKRAGDKAANIDLWEKILDLMEGRAVSIFWTKGHDNQKYNEMADNAAKSAADQPLSKRMPDAGYKGH